MTSEIETEIPSMNGNDVATICKSKDVHYFYSSDLELGHFLASLGYHEALLMEADISIGELPEKQYAYFLTTEKNPIEGFDYTGVDNGIYIYRKC